MSDRSLRPAVGKISYKMFLGSADHYKRKRIEFFFRQSGNFIGWVKALSNTTAGYKLVITKGHTIDARIMNRDLLHIGVSEALIDHYLSTCHCMKHDFLNLKFPPQFEYDLIGVTAVRWAIAREFYRFANAPFKLPRDSEDQLLHDEERFFAADVFAAIAIYRSYQEECNFRESGSLWLRELVVRCIYWVLRTQPDQTGVDLAVRLYLIGFKLGSLSSGYTDKPGERGEAIESKQAIPVVFSTLFECEEQFLKHNLGRYQKDLRDDWYRIGSSNRLPSHLNSLL